MPTRLSKMSEAGWSREDKGVWLHEDCVVFGGGQAWFHVNAIEVDFQGRACNPDWQDPIDAWKIRNGNDTPQLAKLPNGRKAFIWLENYAS